MIRLDSRNIFLLDGTGAVLSALFTGLVLPLATAWVGLSSTTLRLLAIFPLVYGIYSLSCYRLVASIKPWMLVAIMMANLGYCVVSGLVIALSGDITRWGQLLLTAEILIILGVVALEARVYRRSF